MTDTTQTHTNEGNNPRAQDNDRQWAEKMAHSKEARDITRFETLKQLIELDLHGTAKTAVEQTELRAQVDSIMEKVDSLVKNAIPVEPKSSFEKAVFKADAVVRRALPYVTVAGAAVALGYGAKMGVDRVRVGLAKRVDVSIQPVGAPISVTKRTV